MSGLIAPQAVHSQPLVGRRLAAQFVQVMAAQAHVDLHITPSLTADGKCNTSLAAG